MSIVLSLKLDKGKRILRGHEHFWSVIMERHRAGQTFTRRDIDLASNGAFWSIKEYLCRLEAAKLIERVSISGAKKEVSYRPLIMQARAPRVRRDGTVIESLPATQCMWNYIRGSAGRQGFTFRDLVQWASTDETRISVPYARGYIHMLNVAGYLIELQKGNAHRPTTWRLAPEMNTGPKAPMILATKIVFDANKHEVVGPSNAEEVLT